MTRSWMTTGNCARLLGVSLDFIRGEIADHRLAASVVDREPRPGRSRGNRSYRVYPDQWGAYLRRYWPERATTCSTDNTNGHNR